MTFWITFERYLISYFLQNTTSAVLLLIVMIALTVIITIRSNKKASQAKKEKEKNELLEKRTKKLMALVASLPCVTKRNSVILTNDERDLINDKFPDDPECSYVHAIEKGEV